MALVITLPSPSCFVPDRGEDSGTPGGRSERPSRAVGGPGLELTSGALQPSPWPPGRQWAAQNSPERHRRKQRAQLEVIYLGDGEPLRTQLHILAFLPLLQAQGRSHSHRPFSIYPHLLRPTVLAGSDLAVPSLCFCHLTYCKVTQQRGP